MVVLIIKMHSKICSSVITSGGAKRIISPWVGLANNPLSLNLRQTSQASFPFFGFKTIAFNNPFPLTKVIISVSIFSNSLLIYSVKYGAIPLFWTISLIGSDLLIADSCSNVEIYMKNDYPIVIKYCVASLGYIHLCLSSITTNINNFNDSDEDSD